MHDWSSGEVQNEYRLGDYKARFGTVRFYLIVQCVKSLKTAKQDGDRITTTSTGLIFTSSYGVQRLRPPGRDHNAH